MGDNLFSAATLVGFRARKAAQICAFFALKEKAPKQEGIIEKLKLVKLVYLGEREFLNETTFPMLFDEFYSLQHGPVCSNVLNGINGVVDEEIWGEFIARSGNRIVAMKRFDRNDLDELSDAEVDVLEKVWAKFGDKTSSQIRNWTHKHCPEYTEIEKGRIAITYKEVFAALGMDNAEELDAEIRAHRRSEALLNS